MLDMGQVEAFAAADEAKTRLGHVSRLWRALAAWLLNSK